MKTILSAGCVAVALCMGCAVEGEEIADDASEIRAPEGGGGAPKVDGGARATRPIRILHWNISGAVLNKGWSAVVDKMLAEVDARKPDVVSINEGCRDQVEHMRDELRERGFDVTLQFAPTGNNALCVHSLGTNTSQAGPAILAVGGTNGQNHYWKGTKSVDERTDRGMACLTANLGKPVRVCSLHLATADNEAAAQVESMLGRFGSSFADAPAVLVGDFNASPDFLKKNAPSLYAPSGLFHEADAADNEATHGEGKIDFVFMSKAHFAPQATTGVKDMGQHDPWWGDRRAYSDHRLVSSEIGLYL